MPPGPKHQVAPRDDTTDFGDYARDWDEEIELQQVVEPLIKYDINETSHVFYPICLGDVLGGRYLIEHKLGYGGFSTVWMAHDLQDSKDVALKIMASGWEDRKIAIQDEITRTVSDTSRLVMYKDTFLLPEDPKHRVIVLPLMGPCLTPISINQLSMPSRMSAAKQLLEIS